MSVEKKTLRESVRVSGECWQVVCWVLCRSMTTWSVWACNRAAAVRQS